MISPSYVVRMIDTRAIRLRWEADGSKRDERGKRVFAASEARAAGWGGVAAVAEITGLARSRIIRGLKDLDGPALEPGRIRRAGGGRHRVTATDSTLLGELKRLVEPVTMGDPMRPLTWVSKSREKLACELNASGHAVSPNTVGRLLVDELEYSRQVNRKTLEGASHPDRDVYKRQRPRFRPSMRPGCRGSRRPLRTRYLCRSQSRRDRCTRRRPATMAQAN